MFYRRVSAKDGLGPYCKPCGKADTAKWRMQNKEKKSKLDALYYTNNKQKKAEYNTKYYIANREAIVTRATVWKKENPLKNKKHASDFAKNNLHKKSAAAAQRRSRMLKATPTWANKEQVEKIYETAALMTRDTDIPHHVDHIVPLQSKVVCGLHVENNLRVMIGEENRSKGNRYWPDMPEKEKHA